MTFAEPAWLWLLLVVPLVLAVERWIGRRDHERLAGLVSRALWPRVMRRTDPGWRVMQVGLTLLGVAGIVLALARPQWGIVREKVEREGVDVVFVLDTSGSMATEDVAPNRFFLARTALLTLASRLEGDRLALVAFEGEAYPLVPLTLDADALGLFLETLEPGVVPAAGSSVGAGLVKGLGLFVDKERSNKVMILVSDGEDLEGEVEPAVQAARQAGVIVHSVGVGTETGEPVPEFDRDGNRAGFKKQADGSPVVSRLHAETLEAVARGTGGRFFRVTPTDTSLSGLAAVIDGMEQKSLAREFAYRKRERFQLPLAVGLAALALALVLPLPVSWRRQAEGGLRTAAVAGLLLLPNPVGAQEPSGGGWVDELLLRPWRFASRGLDDFQRGNHPAALEAFEKALAARPTDAQARFNVGGALYKNGKYDEAAAQFKSLAERGASLTGPASFNLGNTMYQKKDYAGAVRAYRDALRAMPDDADARRNLELALRAQEQQEQQKQQQQKQDEKQDQKQDQQPKPDQQKDQKQPSQSQPKDQQPQERPQSKEEKEQERFRQETGMPKQRAMQLLDALQQNEKNQQKKLLAKKAKKKEGKDW